MPDLPGSAHLPDAGLLARARVWADEDPDPRTAAELRDLITTAAGGDPTAAADLADRFDGTLEFGTAGLRGVLGAGPNRMNRVVVSRAAAGLSSYVRAQGGTAIVIGFDARHNSDVFARDTAEIASGAGLRAFVLPRPLPTPVLAFAIRHLGVDAGVMVTASHNPPQDNGYKVYLGDGAQIVPPADADIAARIAAVGPLASVARGDDWTTLDEDVLQAYLERAVSLVGPGPRRLAIVTTALHGVGGEVLLEVLRRGGFDEPPVVPVAAQQAPDPDFPTVSFPNPEEPGAIDLALATARDRSADIVIANDPDADRCAVALPDRDGDWAMLRGDEVGVLLGWWALQRAGSSGAPVRGTFANSIVSSGQLAALAASVGVEHAATLTGFKWISRVPGLSYGYEEALGYCVDPAGVRDKDGITAALWIAEMAARLAVDGDTLHDALDEIARRTGVYRTDQLSVRGASVEEVRAPLDRLRTEPPTQWGGRRVELVEDLATGAGGLPPTDGLRITLAGGGRVIIRPSGTEPKLKCYLEVVVPVTGDVDAARAAAGAALVAIRDDVAAALGVG